MILHISPLSITSSKKFSNFSSLFSAVFSGGARGARAAPEFGGSQKGQSLISAYQSLAITTNTPGFEKLNTALNADQSPRTHKDLDLKAMRHHEMVDILICRPANLCHLILLG